MESSEPEADAQLHEDERIAEENARDRSPSDDIHDHDCRLD